MSNFFDIGFGVLNLFSFVLGMLYAVFCSYGWFGKRDIWLQIVLYFAGLSIWYYIQLQYKS